MLPSQRAVSEQWCDTGRRRAPLAEVPWVGKVGERPVSTIMAAMHDRYDPPSTATIRGQSDRLSPVACLGFLGDTDQASRESVTRTSVVASRTWGWVVLLPES